MTDPSKAGKQWIRRGTVDYRLVDGEEDGHLVRPYERGDEAAILELFELSFHVARSGEHFRWKYLDHPGGGPMISLAFSPDGRLAAHYAAYPSRFRDATGGSARQILALQVGDTMTSRHARGVGRGRSSLLGRTTVHHFAHFCEGRVGFNYGFNTGKIQRYYMHLVPGSRFVEAAPYRVLEPRLPEAPVDAAALEIRRLEALDSRCDALFSRAAPDYGLLVERDRRHLRWRYLDCPDVDYLFYGAFAGDELTGWGVFRTGDQGLFWGDALFDRSFPQAPGHLLAAVRARHGGPETPVEAWFPRRPDWWHRILLRLGFEERPEPQELGLIYKPFEAPDMMELFRTRLYYTKGDGDLF